MKESCRAAIEKLRIDNEALKEEMQLENKFSVQPITSAAAATIETLRQQSDACTQRVIYRAALYERNHNPWNNASRFYPCIIEALGQSSMKAYHMLQGTTILYIGKLCLSQSLSTHCQGQKHMHAVVQLTFLCRLAQSVHGWRICSAAPARRRRRLRSSAARWAACALHRTAIFRSVPARSCPGLSAAAQAAHPIPFLRT